VEFNLTLVGDMNGYKLVLHSHWKMIKNFKLSTILGCD
jgi:hypothetical protein